jgi:hypothetical protein
MVGNEEQVSRADAQAHVRSVLGHPLGEALVDAALLELQGVAEERHSRRAGHVLVAPRRAEGRAHMLSAYSSRPISMRRISLVPAPIS